MGRLRRLAAMAVVLAAAATVCLAVLAHTGRPCQREYGYGPGQAPRWATVCE